MNGTHVTAVAIGAAAVFVFSGCGGGSSPSQGSLPSMQAVQRQALPATQTQDTDSLANDNPQIDMHSMLRNLPNEVTIGSTVDPVTGDVNPYGLDIAHEDKAELERGDLVVCDFNDSANVQGTGSAIIALHPTPGSVPRSIANLPALLGCTEVALSSHDDILATAFAANDVAIVSAAGSLRATLMGAPFNAPFGITRAARNDADEEAVFYESNATDGTIVRIDPRTDHTTVIASGFAVNNGAPGSILGPSGLQYDARSDRLYIVDGTNNTVVMFRHVSTIGDHGITVVASGTSFSGPFAKRARLVFSGAPLNGPISSALLSNGNLVIGNTLDPNGENLMIELTPSGHVLNVRNVDTGAAGALFGMVASGSGASQRLFFNDDNDNTVKVLER